MTTINAIVDAVRNVPGCYVLGVEPDADYNRTVITFAGGPEAVVEGAIALIEASIHLLDMRTHQGEHPRLGVVDVCPFVPLRNIDLDGCAELAKQVVDQLSQTHEIPFFLYGHAASSPERTMLSSLRKGEYEGLESRLNPEMEADEATRWPDAGSTVWNETTARSGGITVGSRPILVAYNVNVEEQGAVVAKKIGSLVRTSGRMVTADSGEKFRIHGMLPHVQGMGVQLDELQISQVSLNLLDVKATPLHAAYLACQTIASDHATSLCGSEIVGLVPLQAMLDAGAFFNPKAEDDQSLVEAAIIGLGLRVKHSFEPRERIIEWAIEQEVGS